MSDQQLLAAYRATRWRVDFPQGPEVLQLDALAPAALRPGGFVTGYNPASVQQDPSQNEAANVSLYQALVAAGAVVSPAVSGEGEWQEPGFAATGLKREALVNLGQQWGQNAIVWVDATGRPTLVATRSGFCGRKVGDAIA